VIHSSSPLVVVTRSHRHCDFLPEFCRFLLRCRFTCLLPLPRYAYHLCDFPRVTLVHHLLRLVRYIGDRYVHRWAVALPTHDFTILRSLFPVLVTLFLLPGGLVRSLPLSAIATLHDSVSGCLFPLPLVPLPHARRATLLAVIIRHTALQFSLPALRLPYTGVLGGGYLFPPVTAISPLGGLLI